MAFVIGKAKIAYPPRAYPVAGAVPFLTGGLPKAGSVLTVNTGIFQSSWGTAVPTFMWFMGSVSAYASATNASYSCSANNSATGLSCRIRMGNASWGTTEFWAKTGTVIP